MAISVYVNAVDQTKPDFGNCNITVSENDPDRTEFLKDCANFFEMKGRPVDADRFTAAIPQTPSS